MTENTQPHGPASSTASPGMLMDALRAVCEAIDIPTPATLGDEKIREAILRERVTHTVVALRAILRQDGGADVPWSVAYLRDQLKRHPAEGYKTWNQAVAERAGDDPQ